MKASKYNFFVEADDGEIIAYNAFSGAFTSIDKDFYNLCLKIFSDPGIMANESNNAFDNEKDLAGVIEGLKKGGFLIADNIDEIGIVKKIQDEMRYQQDNVLTITIAPTLNCNFNCVYCLENDGKTEYRMTKDTADNIIRYIDGFSTEGGILKLNWFGGEPTLALDMICYISDAVQEIIAKKHIQLISSINTNGYLLNKKSALMLKSKGVSDAYITVDGCAEEHNNRRPLKNGGGTFDKIMGNVRDTCGIMTVLLRYTVDKGNIEEFPRFLDLLEESGLAEKVRMEVVMVEAYPYSSELVKRRVLSVREFSEEYYMIMKQIIERGIITDILPPSCRLVCNAQLTNSVVVGPRGELFKCMHTIWRPEEAFGNINQPIMRGGNFIKWQDINPMDNKKCRNCKVLPLCMGGCIRNILVKESALLDADGCCRQYKYNIKKLMKLRYLQYRLKHASV